MKEWDELSDSEKQKIDDREFEEENKYDGADWVPKGTMAKEEKRKKQVAKQDELDEINENTDKLSRIEKKLDLILKNLGN